MGRVMRVNTKRTPENNTQFTVSTNGLLRILKVLEDELRAGPDGFVTAEMYHDGGISITTKGGSLMFHDKIDIRLEN